MVVRDGQYVLLAGSTASIKHYDAASNAIKKLRERLIADGALMKNESGYYDVVRDIPLNNPSYAAAIVAGGNTSGPAMWKHKGKALRDFEME